MRVVCLRDNAHKLIVDGDITVWDPTHPDDENTRYELDFSNVYCTECPEDAFAELGIMVTMSELQTSIVIEDGTLAQVVHEMYHPSAKEETP